MTSTPTTVPSVPAAILPRSVAVPALVAALVLAGFGAFTVWVAWVAGPLGFITLAGREPWGLQMLIDLAIACTFGIAWMLGDAQRRRIAAWPFVIATVLLGSLGLLAYVVRRGVAPAR